MPSYKLKVTTVPTNLLEQKIADLQAKMPAELGTAVKEFLDSVKSTAKAIGELMLEAAEFTGT